MIQVYLQLVMPVNRVNSVKLVKRRRSSPGDRRRAHVPRIAWLVSGRGGGRRQLVMSAFSPGPPGWASIEAANTGHIGGARRARLYRMSGILDISVSKVAPFRRSVVSITRLITHYIHRSCRGTYGFFCVCHMEMAWIGIRGNHSKSVDFAFRAAFNFCIDRN